jgi:hypothetical protein
MRRAKRSKETGFACSMCERPMAEHGYEPKSGAVVQQADGTWQQEPNFAFYPCPRCAACGGQILHRSCTTCGEVFS